MKSHIALNSCFMAFLTIGTPCTNMAAAADTEKVIIYIGDDKLSIPKDYVKDGVTGAHVSAIWLPVFLPDLIPAKTNLQLFNQRGWNNKMTILFESGRHFKNPQEVADQMLNWAHISKTDFTQLPNNCRLYKGNMVNTRHLYLCYTPHNVLKVECLGKEDAPFPSCTVYENLSKNTVIYNYGIEHEDEVVSIDDKVRKLYEYFTNMP